MILFLAAGVLLGTVATFAYSSQMPIGVRLCAGACTGLAVESTLGFVAALYFGLTLTSVWVTAGVLFVIGMVLSRIYRKELCDALYLSLQRLTDALLHPRPPVIAAIAFKALLLFLLGLLYSKVLEFRSDGLYTGFVNNIGDLPFHLQLISSFVYSNNFPPENPIYAGVRCTYPFMADFLTAMLVRAGGGSLVYALWVQGMTLAVSFVVLLHYFTLQLTRDRLAAWIAPALVFLSGGLGWYSFLKEYWSNSRGLGDLITHLPHQYTLATDPLLRWGNSLTTLFIPQRGILFGAPIALLIFSQLWEFVQQQPKVGADNSNLRSDGVDHLYLMGGVAGLLPLIHPHTYLVVMGMVVSIVLMFRRFAVLPAFLVPAVTTGVIEIWWAYHDPAVRAASFIRWHLGWDSGNENVLLFWLLNCGIFIPLLVSVILGVRRKRIEAPAALLPFYVPFVLCFIIPNAITLAPWVWDNIKILFYWFVISAPLVALLVSRYIKSGNYLYRGAGVLFLAALTTSGLLDITRVFSGMEECREFDNQGIAIAGSIIKQTGNRSLILHAPEFNSPVFLTGRRSLLGYPGHVWSHGLSYTKRESEIKKIYAGSSEAASLLESNRVDYLLVGSLERNSMYVNDEFLRQFPVVAQSGNNLLLKVNRGK